MAGHSAYRQLLRRHGTPEICNRCGLADVRVLVVHHRDRNRKNNTIENLEWLCQNCHCLEHWGKT
ncbi:MAG: HNH endonuclease [Deltaproteobacteria bacterium]|nr:HNH endonuclease [Deltaproteobacteria bacterium]